MHGIVVWLSEAKKKHQMLHASINIGGCTIVILIKNQLVTFRFCLEDIKILQRKLKSLKFICCETFVDFFLYTETIYKCNHINITFTLSFKTH